MSFSGIIISCHDNMPGFRTHFLEQVTNLCSSTQRMSFDNPRCHFSFRNLQTLHILYLIEFFWLKCPFQVQKKSSVFIFGCFIIHSEIVVALQNFI